MRRYECGRVRSALLLLVLVCVAAATPLVSVAQTVTFHAQTALVQVPVSVLKHGAPVAGLQASDFQLYLDGKKVPLVSLDYLRQPESLPPPRRFPPGVSVNFE